MDVISELLASDGYIITNKALIKRFGLHSAVILGELCSEYNYWKRQDQLQDGMFYSTRENIEENTGLNEHFQRKALTELVECGIITICKKGLPAVNYYKIDFDKLLKILTSSDASNEGLDIKSMELNNNKVNNNKNSNNKLYLSKDKYNNSKSENFLGSIKKEPKQNLYSQCISLIYNFTTTNNCVNIIELLKQHLDLMVEQRSLKGLRQYQGILNKLQKIHENSDLTYEEIIDYSIEHGYGTFYELKKYNGTNIKKASSDIPSDYTQEMRLANKKALQEAIEDGTATKF